MQLPGARRAFVSPAKVRDYLLSPVHPIGWSKAAYFESIGFRAAAWPKLLRAIEALAVEGEAELGEHSPFGQKYLVRGNILAPDGRATRTVTVWIVRAAEDFPRFVAAYPE